MTNLINNPWVITIIGGLVVTIAGVLLTKFFIKNKTLIEKSKKNYSWKKNNSTDNDNNIIMSNENVSGDNYVNINVHDRNKEPGDIGNNLNINDLKKIINILFVDDDITFKIVNILKKQGWVNSKIITDITNIDKYEYVHIFFIDINGVGKKLNLEHQGMDLAYCIKQKFKEKKVVLYSTNTNRDISHPVFKVVDGILPKDAQVFHFTDYIEQFSKEIKLKNVVL